MRAVQLVQVHQAVPATVAHDLPVYQPAVCRGCRLEAVCRDRGVVAQTSVVEVVGKPSPCRIAGVDVVACRVEDTRMGSAIARRERPLPVAPTWLVDASVFINAFKGYEPSLRIIESAGKRLNLATTLAVRRELLHSYRLPACLDVVDVASLDPALEALGRAHTTEDGRTPSPQDLSLVQALLEDRRFAGVITDDGILAWLHPASYVAQRAGRRVEVLSSEAFAATHGKLLLPSTS